MWAPLPTVAESPRAVSEKRRQLSGWHRAQLTPEKEREYDAARRLRRKKTRDDAKSVPCADCGIQYPPYVMDFDHVRGEKIAAPGLLYTQVEAFQIEIAKCEVVCANCHRERTYGPDA